MKDAIKITTETNAGKNQRIVNRERAKRYIAGTLYQDLRATDDYTTADIRHLLAEPLEDFGEIKTQNIKVTWEAL